MSVSWHPSGMLIATASTDYRCRVVNAHIEEVDGPFRIIPQMGNGIPDPGACILEFEQTRSWVNDAQWSPSGLQLAFIGHDGLLHVVKFSPDASSEPAIQTVKTSGLPACRLLWLSESGIVTVGHNMNPDFFNLSSSTGKWAFLAQADSSKKIKASNPGLASVSAFGSARALFASKVTKGISESSSGVTSGLSTSGSGGGGPVSGVTGEESWMTHHGPVTWVAPYAAGRTAGTVATFSTSGLDGRVAIFTVPELGEHVNAASLGL